MLKLQLGPDGMAWTTLYEGAPTFDVTGVHPVVSLSTTEGYTRVGEERFEIDNFSVQR
jgi:hypothetical protein